MRSLGILLCAVALCAQSNQQAPVFRGTSRLIVEDVVVTDGAGRPVRDLKASDFQVAEDGKPQTIESFTAHMEGAGRVPAKSFKLPPHTFTNVPMAAEDAALTVVLFDELNTPVLDQVYARKQLLKVLESLPAGQRVALFVLGSQLRMVQDFTGSSEQLVAAAKAIQNRDSAFLRGKTQQERDADLEAAIVFAETSGPSGGGPGAGNLGKGGVPSTASMTSDEAPWDGSRGLVLEDYAKTQDRIGQSVQALLAIARMTAGFKPRKNLIWLAADFPFATLTPQQMGGHTQFEWAAPSLDVGREVAAVMRDSRIAIYPVDTSGFGTNSTDISSDQQSQMQGMFVARSERFSSMENLAHATGGHAFFNTNDISQAVARSLEEGTNYYTLAYRPTNGQFDGKVRKVRVTLDRPGRLTYREAYLAVPDDAKREEEVRRDEYKAALTPGIPAATGVFVKAMVESADEGGKVRVTCLFDAHGAKAQDLSDGRKLIEMDYAIAAWSDKGKNEGGKAGQIALALSKEEYAQVLKEGVQRSEEFKLPKGSYHLKIAVADRHSNNIGTLEVPAVVK